MYRRRHGVGDPQLNLPPLHPPSAPGVELAPWLPGALGPQFPGLSVPTAPMSPEPAPHGVTDVPEAQAPPPMDETAPPNGAPDQEVGWPADLGQALKENATKIAIFSGLVLGTGVVIGYFVGRGAKR